MTQLRAEQLSRQLAGGLSPVYFIHGDETLLVDECADAVRATARQQGYSDRQVFNADSGFDWNTLSAASDSLSLFSERRILELRLPTGKPGREGARALCEYAGRLPQDTVLLLISAKLEAAARKSKWVQALDKVGITVPVWPVEASRLPAWIDRRMRTHSMLPSPDALQLIADRVEGNLLAAAQEIEKLYLLHGPGPLDLETVAELVADSARYDIFVLVDAALAGDAVYARRVLAGLRGEGVEPVLVLWALSREIRSLASMARAVKEGVPLARVLTERRVWEKRKPLISGVFQRIHGRQWWTLLQRCAFIDRIIKGRAPGSAWDELLQLTLWLAGVSSLPVSA
jgi:DNA polymerase-3 subunit delta